jgi:hypothetical protein
MWIKLLGTQGTNSGIRNRANTSLQISYTHLIVDAVTISPFGPMVWTQLYPAGTLPTARYNHSAIYDPVGRRMVVFGGNDGSARDDVWSLSLENSPTWSAMTVQGNSPPPRGEHSAIYDPIRRRMIIYGGTDGANGFLGDVWALSLAGPPAWAPLTPAGPTPTPRINHTAIYDPLRDRMIVFGGRVPPPYLPDDLWALSLDGPATWSELTASGSQPLGTLGHTAIYDPIMDRMIVYGGNGIDVWSLSLGGPLTWTKLAPAGTAPNVSHHTAIYDPRRQQMINTTGEGTWILSLSTTPTWSTLDAVGVEPSSRGNAASIYDPISDQLLLFGGATSR